MFNTERMDLGLPSTGQAQPKLQVGVRPSVGLTWGSLPSKTHKDDQEEAKMVGLHSFLSLGVVI